MESSGNVAAARFRVFAQEVFSARMIGFALCRCWVYVVFFNTTLLVSKSNPGETLNLLYIVSLVALVAILVAGGFINDRCLSLMRGKYSIWSAALISVIGTSAIPFAGLENSMQVFFLAIAAIATGIGSGLLILFWGRMYSLIGGPSAAAETSVAFILATLPVPLFLLSPFMMQIAVVTALPFISTLTLASELKKEGSIDQPEDKEGSSDQPEGKEDTESSWNLKVIDLGWRQVTLKIVASSIVFGCVISLLRSVPANQEQMMYSFEYNLILPLAAFCAGGVTLLVLFFSKRLDLAFTYRPVLIFMCLGCSLLPFFYNSGAIAFLLTMTGYLCFEIMNWVILSNTSFKFEIPPFRIFGFGRASVSGGVLIGAVLGSFLSATVDYSFEFVVALALLMVLVMVAAYTFTLTERDVAKLTKQRPDRPVRFEHSAERTLLVDEKVDILAKRYHLAGRGVEVLRLLAKGRTGTRIEQELYMSRGTVNTHMRLLYHKLGIHSRQELLDMLDEIDDLASG